MMRIAGPFRTRHMVRTMGAIAAAFALFWLILQLMPVARASGPDPSGADDFQEGVVLVKLKPLVFPLMADAVLSIQGFRTRRSIASSGVRLIEVTPGQEKAAIASLKSSFLVESAELDYVRRPLWTPNDTYYESDQWNMRKINMEEAWSITRGSSAIKVAVIDTGLDMAQPDRARNFASAYNACTGNSDLSDSDGHGTHVSGIIAANTNNGIGVAGVAPNISLMPIKVECVDRNGNSTIYVSTEVDAIYYAADHGAKVISISLGGQSEQSNERDAVNYAMGKGALVVAAAGNEYNPPANPPSYPAGYAGVLAVGATTVNDEHASYSTALDYVAVAAPGGDGVVAERVLSTYLESSYAYMQGTSQATPHVSGLAGLIWSVNPSLTNLQVANIITSTSVDLGTPGRDVMFGWGRIDAYAALTSAQQTVPTPTATPTATATATQTATPTATAALTATPTRTPSPSPSATGTPTPTATAAIAPTATATISPGPSPTPSPTPVPTPLPTPAAGQTPIPIPTNLQRQAYLPALTRNGSGW